MLTRFTKGIKSLLRTCDLFAVSQFIKYKGDSKYSTATGGFCSVTILIIFAELFTSMAIKTVDREIINWTSKTTNQMEPSPTQISVSPSPFLFTVGIMYLDLDDPNMRYFDITLKQNIWNGPIPLSSRNISLVPCTEQHFSMTEYMNKTYHSTPARKWLCPPLGEKFLLFGKFTSKSMSYLQVQVSKCDPLLDLSRPCASASILKNLQAQLGQFILSQFFINPLLNPGSKDYLDQYLEDRNYIAFSSKLGAYSKAYIQDYTIITDQSILPFSVPIEQKGVIIPGLFQNINYEVTSDTYARLFFYKSSTSITYNRSYYKIDQFFYYVGGLVGAIMGGMMLLSAYNQDSFELSLAKDILNNKQGNSFQKYNIFYYIMLFLHSVAKKISDKWKTWESLKELQENLYQVRKQLITRLLFLERSVQVLFEKGQFQAMHLSQKPSIQNLKLLRSFYRMKGIYLNNSIKTETLPLTEQQKTLEDLKKQKQVQTQTKLGKYNQDIEDYDQDQIIQSAKIKFKQSINHFQESLLKGDKISLKIQKGMMWRQNKKQDQNIIIIEELPVLKSEQMNQLEQFQKVEPTTQFIRVKSKNYKSNNYTNNSLDFISFVQ